MNNVLPSVSTSSLHKRVECKTPPDTAPESIQYDLFTWFLANKPDDVSNTIEVWESIPKYFFTPKQVNKLRLPSGHADPYKWEYMRKDIPCMVKIQPALLEQEDGSYKAFFPSVTEELVEEALKKIFTDQYYGLHDAANNESWVRFSLSMLSSELKVRGRTRNRNEIKHAIEVMSNCIITLYIRDKEVWKGAILQDLVTIGRDKYLADTDALHIARLPLLISQGINRLDFRQYNYERLMDCRGQLARWLYKQLINHYVQASLMNTYHFRYSTLMRDSGLLQQGNDRRNRQKVKEALEELIRCGVIMYFNETSHKQSRHICDVTYTVTPSSAFSTEQKAANKRQQDVKTKASRHGITS